MIYSSDPDMPDCCGPVDVHTKTVSVLYGGIILRRRVVRGVGEIYRDKQKKSAFALW